MLNPKGHSRDSYSLSVPRDARLSQNAALAPGSQFVAAASCIGTYVELNRVLPEGPRYRVLTKTGSLGSFDLVVGADGA